MAIAHRGSWLGLPDFGITERIQGLVAPQRQLTSQGGSNLRTGRQAAAPQSTYAGPQTSAYQTPRNLGLPQMGTGQVLGTNTGRRVGAPSGGGGQNFGNAPMESSPEQPSVDYDALIAPALQALDQAIAPAESEYQANLSGIEQGRAKGVAGARQQFT